MLRIALVTPILPIPQDPTRGRFVLETARALSRQAQVRVFFQQSRYPGLVKLRPRSFLAGAAGADQQWDGLDVEAYTYPSLPVLSRGLNGLVASGPLTARARRFKPDLMLGFWVYPDGFAALRAAGSLKIPCVIGALGSDIHIRSGVNVAFTRHVIHRADALLTVSEAMRQYAIQHFGARAQKVQTIVNGFNTSVFGVAPRANSRQALGLPAEGEWIVYVGRLIEAKGLLELIDAFRQISARRPGVRLALIGDGVLRERLQQRIAELGLGQRVSMPGGQSPQRVASWLSASNLLCLPSWSEGYPNVVVEALACGRPVVATDVGGTREIVNPGNGVLVPPRDVPALAHALEATLGREWDENVLAAPMTRTWDDVATETLAVCERVLRPRR